MSDNWGRYVISNNCKFPSQCIQEGIDFALNYKPKDEDIFVVTYPKSGTTWTQQIIHLILNNGIPEKNNKEFVLDSYLEWRGCKTQVKPVIKTHLPFDLMPFNSNAKYLFVFRNPKDTVVSLYHFTKALYQNDFTLDFHQFFDRFINGEVIYGDYFAHVLGYWRHRKDPNVKYLLYEQMIRNPREGVLKISEFLGNDFVVKLKDNNEFVLNEVVKYSTIGFMKTDAKDYEVMFRKGIVGDWRSHFTRGESDLVDRRVKTELAGTGLEHIWTEDMKWN